MWSETNPTSLYLGTTWELIISNKYIRTGSTALATGGSKSVAIKRENLPAIKLKVDSFSLTTEPHVHGTAGTAAASYGMEGVRKEDFGGGHNSQSHDSYNRNTKSAGGGSTGTASPSTEALGSGQALTVQPEYITLKFWKRLS